MDRPLPHRIDVFVAGCPLCREALDLVCRLAPDADRIVVWDVRDETATARARALGVTAVPAVAVDERLVCGGRGADEAALRAALA